MNQSVTYRQNAAECYEAARILLTPFRRPNCLQWRSHGFRWPILPMSVVRGFGTGGGLK
jgi:hypothetical protein